MTGKEIEPAGRPLRPDRPCAQGRDAAAKIDMALPKAVKAERSKSGSKTDAQKSEQKIKAVPSEEHQVMQEKDSVVAGKQQDETKPALEIPQASIPLNANVPPYMPMKKSTVVHPQKSEVRSEAQSSVTHPQTPAAFPQDSASKSIPVTSDSVITRSDLKSTKTEIKTGAAVDSSSDRPAINVPPSQRTGSATKKTAANGITGVSDKKFSQSKTTYTSYQPGTKSTQANTGQYNAHAAPYYPPTEFVNSPPSDPVAPQRQPNRMQYPQTTQTYYHESQQPLYSPYTPHPASGYGEPVSHYGPQPHSGSTGYGASPYPPAHSHCGPNVDMHGSYMYGVDVHGHELLYSPRRAPNAYACPNQV